VTQIALNRAYRRLCVASAILFAYAALAGPAAPGTERKPVAIVAGYPSPDADLLEFAFRQRHTKVDTLRQSLAAGLQLFEVFRRRPHRQSRPG